MHDRRQRRGSYNAMFGFLLPVMVGFAALSVDTSWIRLADSQAQDVADAAAHAALVQLRQSGSTSDAKAAAEKIVNRNIVGGRAGEIGDIAFGAYQRGEAAFVSTSSRPNAVRVEVGRYENDPVQLHFARIFGRDRATVQAAATSATRSLQVVLVMDITGSFRFDIHYARDAAVAFLDVLSDTSGEDDSIAMVTFFNRFGHVWEPWVRLADPEAVDSARTRWEEFTWCNSDVDWDGPSSPGKPWKDWSGSKWHNIAPQMPGCWGDEGGTDHAIGMNLAVDLFEESTDPFAYRAMIVLTDGQPHAIKGFSGRRPSDLEEPWRVKRHEDSYRSISEIKLEAYDEASRAEELGVHVWTVSYGGSSQAAFMGSLVRGDGKAFATNSAADLEPIFTEIANSMPVLIVR